MKQTKYSEIDKRKAKQVWKGLAAWWSFEGTDPTQWNAAHNFNTGGRQNIYRISEEMINSPFGFSSIQQWWPAGIKLKVKNINTNYSLHPTECFTTHKRVITVDGIRITIPAWKTAATEITRPWWTRREWRRPGDLCYHSRSSTIRRSRKRETIYTSTRDRSPHSRFGWFNHH